jgi:hypothetical protein
MRESAPPAGCRVLVVVRRNGQGWQATTATLGLVRTHSLTALDRRVRASVGAYPVDYEFHTGDTELDRLVSRERAARVAARQFEDHARRLARQILRRPTHYSGRDLGILLDLSYQRVHQLLQQTLNGSDTSPDTW